MKKNYIAPITKAVMIDSTDSILLVTSGSVEMGTPVGDGEEVTADAREEKIFDGNNLWDDEW